MMYSFSISSSAIDDITDASEWYDNKSEGLGEQLRQSIYSKFDLIEQYPERYPKRRGNFRETPLKKFPYTIVYRYNKIKRSIIITSVFNTYRNPDNKYKR
jgi:plasmid stabilization system protein ParE